MASPQVTWKASGEKPFSILLEWSSASSSMLTYEKIYEDYIDTDTPVKIKDPGFSEQMKRKKDFDSFTM